MASLNKVFFIGNLTAEPELKNTNSGTAVCNFSIAVNRPFVKEGQKTVDFINVVAWAKTAEFLCKYFKKGDPVFIQGRIETRDWVDENKVKRVAVEVIVDELQFVKNKSDGNGAGAATSEGGDNENF